MLLMFPWLIVIYVSAVEKMRVWKLILGGLIFSFLWTTGAAYHMVFVMIIWVSIIILLTINLLSVEKKKNFFTPLLIALAFSALGTGLSAIYLCPLFEGMRYTRLHIGLSAESVMRQLDINLPPIYLATLFVPDLFGNITGINFILPHSVFFPDANMSGGMAVTFLAMLGFIFSVATPATNPQAQRQRWASIAAAGLYVFAILCAMGVYTPFYRYVIGYLPLVNKVPSLIRYRAIQCFATAILVAVGLENLLRNKTSVPSLLRRWAWLYVIISLSVIGTALVYPLSQDGIYRSVWQGSFGSKVDSYFFIRQPVGSYSPKTSKVKKIAVMFNGESKGQIRYADNSSILPEDGIFVKNYYAPNKGWFEFDADIPPGKFIWIYPQEGRGGIGYMLGKSSATCFSFNGKKWNMHINRTALCLYTGAQKIATSLISKFQTGDILRKPMVVSILYYILIAILIILCAYYFSPRRFGILFSAIAIIEFFIFGMFGFYKATYRPDVALPHQVRVIKPLDFPFIKRMVFQLPAVADNLMLRIATDQPFHDNFVQLNGRFALMGYQVHPLEIRFKHAIETAYGQPMDWPIYEDTAPMPISQFFLNNFSVGYLLTTNPVGQFRSRISVPLPDENGYFVHINTDALPRAFTMDNIIVTSEDEQLKQLVSGDLHEAVYISTGEGIKSTKIINTMVSHFEFLQRVNQIEKLKLDNPNQIDIEINVTVPAMLVLTEIWYPGWQAAIDGKSTKVYRVNYCQRGVWLEKGKHKVVFRFRPLAWRIGGAITLATAGLMLVSLLASLLIHMRRKTR